LTNIVASTVLLAASCKAEYGTGAPLPSYVLLCIAFVQKESNQGKKERHKCWLLQMGGGFPDVDGMGGNEGKFVGRFHAKNINENSDVDLFNPNMIPMMSAPQAMTTVANIAKNIQPLLKSFVDLSTPSATLTLLATLAMTTVANIAKTIQPMLKSFVDLSTPDVTPIVLAALAMTTVANFAKTIQPMLKSFLDN
jgi:hypothetical protein